VQDYSVGDSLVGALPGEASRWIETNLNDTILASFRAHAIWIYRKDGSLAASRNLLYTEALPQVPLPPGQLEGLFASAPSCHFFAWTPPGLMEVRGAAIRSPKEEGNPPARGYFFAGRLWLRADLKEMSLLDGNQLTLVKSGPKVAHGEKPAAEEGDIHFCRDLPGWDGKTVAILKVRNESPEVQLLQRSGRRLFLGTIGFAAALFLVLLAAVARWLNWPIKRLAGALGRQDPAHLEPLLQKGDEFGDLARLMRNFFVQREELVREMAERASAELALHESEDRLRHSQKMEAVGRLAGGVAHDFNNLLTAIIGYSDLISVRSREPGTRDEAAIINKAACRAADLTRQLLAFSRKQILQPRVLDLNELVRDIQKLLGRVIGERVPLRFEAAPGECRVCADPTQLEQVVLNLGVNARDAMPRGGLLVMRTERREISEPVSFATGTLSPGLWVALSVRDSGCGMDAETQARIFEPFFTTKGPGKGTGLGLATVYGIVQQSGGAILVESAVEQGTTFTVYLPQVEAPLESLAAAPEPAAHSSAAAVVLVVEDEEIVSEFIGAVLTTAGYDVLSACDGPSALALAHSRKGGIDLLLTDVIMPQMAGPELARALHAFRPDSRVLYISGYSEVDISEDGVLAAGVNLLPKPFTPDALLRRVGQVLEAKAES
jgi:signal transduction histidine kinase/CheY-like chemotaxis protein